MVHRALFKFYKYTLQTYTYIENQIRFQIKLHIIISVSMPLKEKS